MGLKLKASLVTLSACDTALGSGYFTEPPPGDDLIGLNARLSVCWRAVGACESLGNQRSLNRRFDAEFLSSTSTRRQAAALAQAQRAMRMSRTHNHPYYWGAFVLVGQMR